MDELPDVKSDAASLSSLIHSQLLNNDLTFDAPSESLLTRSLKLLLNLSSLFKYLLIILSTSYSRELPQHNRHRVYATPEEKNPVTRSC